LLIFIESFSRFLEKGGLFITEGTIIKLIKPIIMSSFKKILPLLNRIVVRKLDPQTKTSSGIIISKTESASYGVVVEAGPGNYDSEGKIVPICVKVGDNVLLPDFGGQKVKINEQELFIYRDSEIIARLE